MMNKNYNIDRQQLRLPEYGRHIQDMVLELSKIENREERNLRAKALIAIMANIQHQNSDTPDFERKLWDHLFIMADYQLDIDAPYPAPTADTIMPPPHKMEYPRTAINMKHYGKNVRNVIRSLHKLKDQDTVDVVIYNVARYMRTKSYEFNQEHPDNSVIIKDIKRMSEFDISIDENAITQIKSEYKNVFTDYKKIRQNKKNNKKR